MPKIKTNAKHKLLTSAQQRDVAAIIGVGGSLESAATYVGCTITAIHETMKVNEDFAQLIRRQSLRPELEILRSMLEAARDPKQWRAAAWALERLYPARYVRRRRESVGPRELRDFVSRLLAILQSEISSPDERERLTKRITAELLPAEELTHE